MFMFRVWIMKLHFGTQSLVFRFKVYNIQFGLRIYDLDLGIKFRFKIYGLSLGFGILVYDLGLRDTDLRFKFKVQDLSLQFQVWLQELRYRVQSLAGGVSITKINIIVFLAIFI